MRTAESVVFTDWPPGARRTEHVDAQVGGVDGHLHLVGLGEHHDRGRRGVDPTLGLGHGHTLDPVGPTLVFHAGPGVGPFHHERDLVEAVAIGGVRGEDLESPSVLLGVTPVHLEEVLGEQVRLLAALGAADLDDDVATDVGILGQEHEAELVFELGRLRHGLVDLGVGEVPVLTRGVGQHLARRLEVLLGLAAAGGPRDRSASRSLWRRDASRRRAWSATTAGSPRESSTAWYSSSHAARRSGSMAPGYRRARALPPLCGERESESVDHEPGGARVRRAWPSTASRAGP